MIERESWVFARKGQGYLALRSRQPYRWQDAPGEDQQREMIADGKTNIWVCELGSQTDSGSFENFIEKICDAPLHFNGLKVTYHSPSCGKLVFGWNGPFLRNDQPVRLDDFPRYDHPYARAVFPPEQVEIRHGEQSLILDWRT